MYYKYVIEIRRGRRGWTCSAIWAVKPCDFHEFLGHINALFTRAGEPAATRIRRIQGNPLAKLTWPKDKM